MMAPKNYDVSRTIEIDAPREVVYSQVNTLANMEKWGPWRETDTLMKSEIIGQDGAVGAINHWDGPDAGEGEQKLTNLIENELVECELHFIKPWQGEAKAYFKLADGEAGKTSISWGMTGEQNMMMRAMSMLPGMGMDDHMGPMFDKGLSNLKTLAESKAVEINSAEIGAGTYGFIIMDRPAVQYVAMHKEVGFDQIEEFYQVNFPAIAIALGASGNTVNGPASGIYLTWDEENKKTDMAAAFPVEGNVMIEGYETMVIPSSKVLKATYTGDYEQSKAVHEAINQYMAANGMEQNGAVIEEYVVGPATEEDSGKWVTVVTYAIK